MSGLFPWLSIGQVRAQIQEIWKDYPRKWIIAMAVSIFSLHITFQR